MSDDKTREQLIWAKLLSGRSKDMSSEEEAEIVKMAKALSTVSSRHHFIPQFYIKGFTDTDGLLFVYDKGGDRLLTKKAAPKGMFFEKDRNSVVIDILKISIIEDHMFNKIDHQFSTFLSNMRDLPNDGTLLSVENTTMLIAFVIDLFWRNPITDDAFEDRHRRSEVYFPNPQTGEMYRDEIRELEVKNDPVQKKIERSKMTLNCINEILNIRPPGTAHSKLWEFEQNLFVLGDYPMLYNGVPGTLTDLITFDFLLPVSSNRLFSNSSQKGLNFKVEDAFLLNALIIDQSTKYICSADLSILEKSVAYYKGLKNEKLLPYLKKSIFNRIVA